MAIIPPPHEDYELNAFLARLAKQFTGEDFDLLKATLNDKGMGVMKGMSSSVEVFNLLQIHGFLTRNNLVILQAVIWNIGRKDLYQQIVEFCHNMDDTLYTFTPKDTPENGYRYVKFHLQGAKVIGRDELESLRMNTARWLCVPPEFVVIRGFEPSQSWVITVMIPEMCANILISFPAKQHQWMTSCGIDRFEIDGKISNWTVRDVASEMGIDLVAENARLRRREADLTTQVESMGLTSMALLRENTSLKELNRKSEEGEKAFFGSFVLALGYLYVFQKAFLDDTSGSQSTALSPKWRTAINIFEQGMDHVKTLGYDMDVIHHLLGLHRIVVVIRHLETVRIRHLETMRTSDFLVDEAARKVFLLTGLRCMELEEENIHLKLKIRDTEGARSMMTSAEVIGSMPILNIPIPTVTIGGWTTADIGIQRSNRSSVEFLEFLGKLSKRLEKSDRDKILVDKDCPLEVVEKDYVSRDEFNHHVLEFVLVKTMLDLDKRALERKQYPENVVKSTLEKIGRRDLVRELDE